MAEIKAGDKVRIKDRPGWPTPPGYQLAKSEGDVIEVREEQGFVIIHLTKTKAPVDLGTTLTFREDAVEKI